jgi:hypothetical protein
MWASREIERRTRQQRQLNQEVDNTYKVKKSDWVKRESWQVRQDEWKFSGNLMTTVKPNIRRYSSTEDLPRRLQVVVLRLRMGYTNITHAHRLSDDPKPYCNECEQDLTVWHLLWQCRNKNQHNY